MKRILIAFDESPGAEAALLDMVRGAFPEKCEANVLTVADVWLPGESTAADPSFPDRGAAQLTARQHALEALAMAKEISMRGAERLRSLFPRWNIQHTAVADSPAWAILAEVRKWGADLVVIGSHGRSTLERFFLGSVSYKVAAEASCSVRIFKAHHRAGDHRVRVLIAVDGSMDAEGAVNEVLARNWPPETKFLLMTVLDQKIHAATLSHRGLFRPQVTGLGEVSVSAMLEERAERFRKRRFEAGTKLVEGDPKSLVLHEAAEWEADCVFVGARGLEHGDRLYLGTFASAIATRVPCTVEIIRPAARKADQQG